MEKVLDAATDSLSGGKDNGTEKNEIECDRLYQKVSQLQIEVDWPKKGRLSGMSVSEKVKCMDCNDKLVLAGGVRCCNCHALHTTGPEISILKMKKTCKL